MGAEEAMTTAGAVAATVRDARRSKGWSQTQLSGALDRVGVRIGTTSIAKLENDDRQVTVKELVALAYVLDIAPVHLLVPPWPEPGAAGEDEPTDDRPFAVTPSGDTAPAHDVRAWVRGDHPLPGVDARRYHTQVPRHEWAARLQAFAERTGGEIRYIPRSEES